MQRLIRQRLEGNVPALVPALGGVHLLHQKPALPERRERRGFPRRDGVRGRLDREALARGEGARARGQVQFESVPRVAQPPQGVCRSRLGVSLRYGRSEEFQWQDRSLGLEGVLVLDAAVGGRVLAGLSREVGPFVGGALPGEELGREAGNHVEGLGRTADVEIVER